MLCFESMIHTILELKLKKLQIKHLLNKNKKHL